MIYIIFEYLFATLSETVPKTQNKTSNIFCVCWSSLWFCFLFFILFLFWSSWNFWCIHLTSLQNIQREAKVVLIEKKKDGSDLTVLHWYSKLFTNLLTMNQLVIVILSGYEPRFLRVLFWEAQPQYMKHSFLIGNIPHANPHATLLLPPPPPLTPTPSVDRRSMVTRHRGLGFVTWATLRQHIISNSHQTSLHPPTSVVRSECD